LRPSALLNNYNYLSKKKKKLLMQKLLILSLYNVYKITSPGSYLAPTQLCSFLLFFLKKKLLLNQNKVIPG